MNEGVLIFANTSENSYDYLELAKLNARLVRAHLNLPTYIKSMDVGSQPRTFVTPQGNVKKDWRNFGRFMAYWESPFETTYLLDADYLVLSDQLKKLQALDTDFAAHRDVLDLTGCGKLEGSTFGFYKEPMYWATVVKFRKSERAKQIFEIWKNVSENWDYYAALYNFNSSLKRNDYMLTLALKTHAGMTRPEQIDIPWRLPSISTDTSIRRADPDGKIVLEYMTHRNGEQARGVTWCRDTDIHCMNKECLTPEILGQIHATI